MAPFVTLFHADCLDGLAAAWVMRQAFVKGRLPHLKPHLSIGRFIPVTYNDAPPWEAIEGSHVYILDFSYDLETTKEIIDRAQSVTMLDHHPRSEGIVEALYVWMRRRGYTAARGSLSYRSDASGAMMAWDHWFYPIAPPAIIQHVSDRDLWRFALPDTKSIMSALATYPLTLDAWVELFEQHDDGYGLVNFLKQPEPVHQVAARVQSNAVTWALEHTLRQIALTWKDAVSGEACSAEVPLINGPHSVMSDALGQLAQSHLFAAGYYDTTQGRKFSLRSTEFDVRQVATQYGGEGHQRAAGFTVPRDHPLAQL